MSARRLLAVLGGLLAVLVVFVGGVVVGGHAEATGLTQLRDPLRGFLLGDSGESLPSQVLDVLRDDYYKPIDEKKLESLSVDRMIEALNDPYTDYLSADELTALRAATTPAPTPVWAWGWGPWELPRRSERHARTAPRTRPASGSGTAWCRSTASASPPPTSPGTCNRVRGPEGTQVRLGWSPAMHPSGSSRSRAASSPEPPVLSRIETVGARRWATCACHGSSGAPPPRSATP